MLSQSFIIKQPYYKTLGASVIHPPPSLSCTMNNKDTNFSTNNFLIFLVENNTEKVKVINTGVKAWTKCENKGSECGYRWVVIPFPVWLRNRLISAGLEPVLSLTCVVPKVLFPAYQKAVSA